MIDKIEIKCDCVENPAGLRCSLNVKCFPLLHLDALFAKVALFGKAVETSWGGSLKEVHAEGGPSLLIAPPTSVFFLQVH